MRLIMILALCLSTVPCGVARATDITPHLTEASKMMQNGAYVKAIDIITSALSAGNISSDLAARALLMRAQANEKLGRSAFALADYNQALFIQDLSDADRKQAEEGKARVQGGLGVKEPDEQQAASRQQEQSSGVGSFFSNLFGASEPPKEERPQNAVLAVVQREEQQPAKTAPPKQKTPPAAKITTPAANQPPVRVARNSAPAQRPAATQSSTDASGEFSIQFAALMNEDGAISEVNRIAKKYGSDLGGRSPTVVIVPTKDGGTLYKIVAGPYDKATGQATCEILKTKNLNCMVISRKQ